MALTADTIATMPALLFHHAATHAQEVILRKKQRGIWMAVSWQELATRVREVGMALAASGLTSGDVVGVLSNTRPEAVCADLGTLSIGCVSACLVPQDDSAGGSAAVQAVGRRLSRVPPVAAGRLAPAVRWVPAARLARAARQPPMRSSTAARRLP